MPAAGKAIVSDENYFTVSEQFPEQAASTSEQEAAAGRLGAFTRRTSRLANAAAIWFVILLSLVFVYEVVARRVFQSPTGFANQLAAYGMPFIMFLSAAHTLAGKGHVMVDAFVRILSSRTRARLEIVTDALSVVLLAAITVIACGVVYHSWSTGYKTFATVITFPEYIPQLVMPVGLALLTLQQLSELVGNIRLPPREPY